jgi:hypothetical protein
MRAPVRQHHEEHEDSDNWWLDTTVVDGIAWHNIEQRSVTAQWLSRARDGEHEEGKGFLASSMSCARG